MNYKNKIKGKILKIMTFRPLILLVEMGLIKPLMLFKKQELINTTYKYNTISNSFTVLFVYNRWGGMVFIYYANVISILIIPNANRNDQGIK